MTSALGNVEVNMVPRVYGADELGVLSITAPGEAHPRVEYVAGELFVGLNEQGDGAAITQGQVEGWARPFGEVLASVVAATGALPDAVEGSILIEDELLAAAVLVDPARAAAAPVEGDPVVFALARNRLAIVGANDEAGVERVLDLAEKLYDAGGAVVSAHPIFLAEGAWAPFPWRERFPSLEMRFDRVLRLFSVRAYEAQTATLQHPDVHIADPKIEVLDTGVTVTLAAWPKGTATLLPVVDNVIVADPAGSLSVATFSQFLDAAGDAVIRTDLSPTRYYVPGEPPRAS